MKYKPITNKEELRKYKNATGRMKNATGRMIYQQRKAKKIQKCNRQDVIPTKKSSETTKMSTNAA